MMAENDEQTIEVPKKSPIKVIKKPDNIKYHDKLSTKIVPHPAGYDYFWMLADVYLVDRDYEEGYFIEKHQVADFGQGKEVELQVDIPEYIETHPARDDFELHLLYFDRGKYEWVSFNISPPEKGTPSVNVTLPNPWIKDPPIGWGGNLPD